MNAPVTRRALLGATAAVGALSVPAVAETTIGAALPADPDAELFRLLDHWRELQDGAAAINAAFDAASDRAKAAYPARPAALCAPGTDHIRGLCASASGQERTPEGRIRGFYQPGDVEKLRAGPPPMRWACVGDDHPGPPPMELDPRGEARRQEIIVTHDRWSAQREAVEDAVGYTAAVDAFESWCREANAAEDAVKLCAAQTLAGLRRKALWVGELLANDTGDDDVAEVFARQIAVFGGAAL